jgi:hypothetical protein
MEDEPQLSLRQLSQQTELSVLICQRIVRKNLEDLVTAERYRNNILDVFTINSNWLKGIFNKTRLQHARIFVICGNFLHLCCLMNEESSNVHRSSRLSFFNTLLLIVVYLLLLHYLFTHIARVYLLLLMLCSCRAAAPGT